jgi:DNA repair protein RadD
VGIVLRDYQTGGVSELVANMRREIKRQLFVLSTGGGKTITAAFMLDGSRARKQPAWFVVHRRELMLQTSRALTEYGIPHGLVAAREPLRAWHEVQIVLIGSLARRMKHLPPPRLIVPDEAHHARAAGWERMFEAFPDAWVVGLTATPRRLDGRGLGKHFSAIVVGPEMRWLIDNGYLSDYRLFAPPPPEGFLDGVREVAGEYNRADLKKAILGKPQIVGSAIDEYMHHCPHKPAIVRAVDIESSQVIAGRFAAAGLRAIHVDGEMDEAARRDAFEGFANGKYEVMCQVELASEGVDIPGIVAAIDLRPTKSLTYALQFWGRSLRPVFADGMPKGTAEQRRAAIAAGPKPRAYLLDHVGNSLVHGFPDDPREWTLDDKPKSPKPAPVFTCEHCFAVFRARQEVCPECGNLMYDPMGGRARPDEVQGRLQEISDEERALAREQKRREYEEQQVKNKEKFDKKRELRACVTLEDFIELGKKRGYKEGWAKHVWEARQRSVERYRSGYPDRQGFA